MSIVGNTITDVIDDIIDDIGGSLDDIFGSIDDIFDDILGYGQAVDEILDGIFDQFDGGLDGFLQNIINTTGGEVHQTISQLADEPVPEATVNEIVADIDQGNVSAAAEKLAPYSTESYNIAQLEVILSRLDTTIAGKIVVNSAFGVFPPPYVIMNNQHEWSGSNSQGYDFSYITSVEELQAEFISITRAISEVVVHWTDTFTNNNWTAQHIHDAHNATGHNGIGYHYVIQRDGSLQRGRPVNTQGEHAPINGHNEYSIAVALVGGYNCPTLTQNPEAYKSASSLTRQQMTTLYQFIKYFYWRYPGGQAFGHMDIDLEAEDPGFSIPDYVYNNFKKINIITDPANEGPIAPVDFRQYSTEQSQYVSTVLQLNNL